ncbi:hypothetical protein [Paenarthrobacter sp. Z7-10]|uniref:hypothetical protein n=1 Tax=Paenarthrobacter sp. Z7-10 TaxID=2787635 RepID=UPI0022A9D5BB|nr:hypothetical protein [Paenarthrobacter sp. Z7-10]
MTLSSDAAACALGYPAGHAYTISLSNDGVTAPPVTAGVDPDGLFSAKIPISAEFPPGTAYLIVTGSPYDNCEDGASCAGYWATIMVK